MRSFEYYRPQTLPELCQLLQQPGARIVAGGTDVLPQMHTGAFQPSILVDLCRLDELNFIQETPGALEIGAMVTYNDILRSDAIRQYAPALIQAASQIGATMTRSRGTLGGNLGNASPAGDSIPPLLIHEATITLTSAQGDRMLPLSDFLINPGKTALQPGEFIRQVSLQKLPQGSGEAFIKIGPRRGMTISIINAAAAIQMNSNGKITSAHIAVGAAAPTARRCSQIEQYLLEKDPGEQLWKEAARQVSKDISPIDDVRASREYRIHAAEILVYRALASAFEAASGRTL
jgi:carbon-monoxide dehydrogenase medium subunit